jgi:hypothetical protein
MSRSRNLNVPRRWFVERGADDFAFDVAKHIGDFLGPLVDQKNDQENFRVVRRNGVRDVLQEHGFAGARRRDDQCALTFTERRHQIDDTGSVVVRCVLKLEPIVRIQRCQVIEKNLLFRFFRSLVVERLDL